MQKDGADFEWNGSFRTNHFKSPSWIAPTHWSISHSLRPALPRGDGEERQQSPHDVVIVELVPPPLPSLDLLLVLPVVDVVTPEVTQETRLDRGKKLRPWNLIKNSGRKTITGSPSPCPWSCRCSRRTSPWRAGRRWRRRWTWRACRQWGCWRRSSEMSPRSQTPPVRHRGGDKLSNILHQSRGNTEKNIIIYLFSPVSSASCKKKLLCCCVWYDSQNLDCGTWVK